MEITNLLLSNWDSVFVVVCLAAGAILLYKKDEKRLLETILFRLVTEAERRYGGGTGELKAAAVIEWAYDKMPLILRLIITRRELENMMTSALKYAKERWADNPSLLGNNSVSLPDKLE